MVADWLADPTNGVNALLPLVQRDGGDVLPALVADIQDETRDNEAAVKQLAEVSPLLVVHSMTTDLEAGPTQGMIRNGTTALLIRYQVTGSDPATVEQSSYYTLRAVTQSLLRLVKPDNYSARVRGTINILYLTAFTVVRVDTQLADQISTSGLTFSVRWRDTSPEG